MKIIKYNKEYKEKWDIFIDSSKNGTFLLKRNYMEYHQNRFPDNSYIIMDEKNKIKALIPGTIDDGVFYSHKGLTYGGFITDIETKTLDVLEYFNLLNQELKKIGIKKVIYKVIPHIYSNYPSEEDEYILFRLGARIISSGISSVIDLQKEFKYNSLRKRNIKKSLRYNLSIEMNSSFYEFWNILEENLRIAHNTKPVHTLEEILYLKSKFSENINLYTTSYNNEVVAGVVVYENKDVIHIQYISANKLGKEISALDFIFNYLIKEKYKNKKYFDFGVSVENNGYYLNEGLIFQKEGFGARGILYRQYEYEIK